MNKTWFNVTSEGDSIPSWYFKGQEDIDYRMALKIDGALMFGKRVTNPNAVDANNQNRAYKGTEGIIPYTRRLGTIVPNTPGSFTVDTFDLIDRTLEAEYVGNYSLFMPGIQLHQDVENTLKTYFTDTNIIFAKEAVNKDIFHKKDSLAASVNFKYLCKSERTFMFHRLKNWNNPKTFGADDFKMKRMGLVLPVDQKKDKMDGSMKSSIGTRYKGLNGMSRRMKVWRSGTAMDGIKVGDIDEDNTYQLAHIGAEHFGGNRFVLIDPTS